MNFKKKLLIILFLVIYNLSLIFNSLQYFPFSKVSAEDPVQSSNVVAVFVDKDISSSQSENIKWYATSYVQQKISNTKALVLPIDKNNFKASDISKILENLYLEGDKDGATKLLGTVLIGDLPLPVVKRDGFVYPSIYPYVDFKDKKFIYNKDSGFFEYNGSDNGSPEIWHGVINLGTDANKYSSYFDKLKNYNSNPGDFAEKKIWYEDFIYLKRLFNENNLSYYINSLIFAEDVGFRRYTNVLMELMNVDYQNLLKGAMGNFSGSVSVAQEKFFNELSGADTEFDGFKQISDVYLDKITEFKSKFMNQEVVDNIQASSQQTPTLILEQSIQSFFKNYTELFGTTYISKFKDNILSTGRYTENTSDSHLQKVYLKDEVTKKLLIEYNKSIESLIDEKIKSQGFAMNIPVPTSYESWTNNPSCAKKKTGEENNPQPITDGEQPKSKSIWTLNGGYENFYFGKNAKDISYAGDFSYYRGTYKNYKTLADATGLDIKNLDDVSINPLYMSIGVSNSWFARQTSSNRGYNVLNAQSDGNLYSASRCSNSEDNEQWSQRIWGGASPLNYDNSLSTASSFTLKNFDYRNAWNPSYNKAIGGSIFDIAGSRLTDSENLSAYSYKSYKDYSSLIKTTSGVDSNISGVGYCQQSKDRIDYSGVDFFNVFNGQGGGAGDYVSISVKSGSGSNSVSRGTTTCLCESVSEMSLGCDLEDYKTKSIYSYNTVSSVVYHKSPTDQELSGMNYITQERPIDDPRYVDFLGLGGDEIKFIYPDFFKVEVYKKQNEDTLVLKSQSEIEIAIKDYLKNKVKKYNEYLQSQLDKKSSYYNINKSAYDMLGSADSKASPNRNYDLLSEDVLEKFLGDDNIKRISASLYYLNLPWSERTYDENVLKSVDNFKTGFDINKKLQYVETSYLKSDSDKDIFTNVDFVSKGYEAGYINSDGVDSIDSTKVPDDIVSIQNQRSSLRAIRGQNWLNLLKNLLAQQEEQECGVGKDGGVMLWNWPSSFMCWVSKTMQKPFSLTIDYACALGSLIQSMDDFDELSGLYDFGNSKYFTDYIRKTYGEFTKIFNGDKWPFYARNWQRWIKSDSLANNTLYAAWNSTQKSLFRDLQSNINVSIIPSENISLVDSDDKNFVKINSLKDFGTINATVALIGENCFLVNNTDVCKKNLELSFNPYKQEALLPIKFQEYIAGNDILQLKFCKDGVCYYLNKSISVLPGAINSVTISTPTDKVLKGGQLPFVVSGLDKFQNQLGQTVEEYEISANMGKINVDGSLVDKASLTNFKKGYFIYDSSNLSGTQGNIDVTIKAQPTDIYKQLDPNLPISTKNLTLVDGTISVLNGGSNVSEISYSLPDSLDVFYYRDQDGNYQLNPNSLLKYTIQLKANDGTPLSSTVSIKTDNNILLPGELNNSKKVLYTSGAKTVLSQLQFQQKTDFIITGGSLDFYLHPVMKSGKDNLKLSVYGLPDINIPINVKAAKPEVVEIKMDKEKLNVGDATKGKVYVQDIWGNTVDYQDTKLVLNTVGNIKVNGQKQLEITATAGVASFDLASYNPGGRGYVYAYMKDLAMDQQIPDYKAIMVTNRLWPSDKLNIMYLTLLGSDWGNMWGFFSDKKDIAKNILSNSDKTLSITTMLVDPQAVKKVGYVIRQDGKVMNYDSLPTSLLLSGGNIFVKVGETTNTIGNILLGNKSDFAYSKIADLPTNLGGNNIYYLAQATDSVITSNIFDNKLIVINGQTIVNFDDSYISTDAKINLSSENNGDYGKFDVLYKGKLVGNILVHRNDTFILDNNTKGNVGGNYSYTIGFSEGSTNLKRGIFLYNIEAALSGLPKSYKSLEDSVDSDLDIGFKGDFKNISHFSNGNNVGDSTKAFASDLLINYGDPLVTRVSTSDTIDSTKYDGGIGKLIYSDTKGGILKPISMDFNNDGQKDLIVAYKDGSIRMLKNYGGNDNFSDLGEFMVIADGVKDIYAGDIDGDMYEDLIIRTNKDTLRAYLNKNGMMEVDGRPVCLDIDTDDPQSVKYVSQLFFKDMNQDGKLDIVSSDRKQDIKIFYGGKSDKGYNYISNELMTCDSGWYDRQKDNTKLVKSYALTINPLQKIYDQSLITWDGLTNPNSTATASSIASGWTQTLGLQTFSSDAIFGGSSNNSDVNFYKIAYLDGTSPLEVYKVFTDVNGGQLIKGDLVKIDVYVKAIKNTTASYIENLMGPWLLLRDNAGKIATFSNGTLSLNSNINWKLDGYQFMIEDLALKAGEQVGFSYMVNFAGTDVMKIDVDTFNEDKYPDIKVYPSDGCIKGYWMFYAKNDGKDYEEKKEDLLDKYVSKVSDLQSGNNQVYSGILQGIKNSMSGSDLSSLFGMTDNGTSIGGGFFESIRNGGDLELSLNVDLFGEQLNGYKNDLMRTMRKLCKGFVFGKASGCDTPAIPFNIALLAPGKMSGGGCFTDVMDALGVDPMGSAMDALGMGGAGGGFGDLMNVYQDGIPMFWFPGKFGIPSSNGCTELYLPNTKTKLSNKITDMAPGGCAVEGVPSMIRLYVAPTTTMSVGFGACFGPYKAGMNIPAPFSAFMGNCVAAAMPLNLYSCPQQKVGPLSYAIERWQYELSRIGSCKNYNPYGRQGSPFNLMSNYQAAGFEPTLNDGTYLGVVNLNTYPSDVDASFLGGIINLQGGVNINNKIGIGDVKGIFSCIIQKWLDNQIRYIINNLTSMTMYLFLPDFDEVTQGFKDLKTGVESIPGAVDKSYSDLKSIKMFGPKSSETESSIVPAEIRDNIPRREAMKAIGKNLSNPFEQISNLFEETPLIKIYNRSLAIQVPFLFMEDVERYFAYLREWLERNEAILREWENVGRDISGTCDSKTTQEEKQQCNETASQYFDASVKAGQLVKSVRKNMKTLQAYKEYPMKLYEYVHATDRYLSELSCILENFISSTVGWLKQNSTRFERWVDFIILLIGVIKTWQLLIDFSVNWKEKCGKCRQDTYDGNTCLLSLLCIDLPILPIPPFKIPDIYLDFSHFDLGIDIILPTFKFLPRRITLPKLPDLPLPNNFSFNLSLPDIPLLPALPELPELPSFLPRFDLDLPLLPPAPKIPALLPMIQMILSIAEFIGTIICIIKNGVGLVAEANLKQRIEQLTQRTWGSDPFDSFRITSIKPPLKGFDFRMDSYVNLRFNFDLFYQFAQALKTSINQTTGKIMKDVNKKVQSVEKSGNSIMEDKLKSPFQDLKVDVDLNSFNSTKGGYDFDKAYSILKSGLMYLKETDYNVNRQQQAQKIISMMDTSKNISPNISGVEDIKNQTTKIIKKKSLYYEELSNRIKSDYNEFIKSIGNNDNSLVSDDNSEIKLSTSLFNGNKEIVDTIKNQEHPYKTYIDINTQYMGGLKKAIETHTAEDLNMTQDVYNKSTKYINELYALGNETSSYFDDKNLIAQTTNSSGSNNETVSTETSSNLNSNPSEQTQLMDLTQYIKGLFVLGNDGYYHSIINWEDFGDTVSKNGTYTITDMNGDNSKDILLWDGSNIYVKYANQQDIYNSSNNKKYSEYYMDETFESVEDILSNIDSRGFYNVEGTKFKIWDGKDAVNNFSRGSQSSDVISFNFKNDKVDNDGYVIELIQRVDAFNDRLFYYYMGDLLEKKYVLVVGSGFDENNAKVSLDGLNGFAYDLTRSLDILKIANVDMSLDNITVAIDNIDKKWYYAKIAKLTRDGNTYSNIGPWSHQEVSGKQIWADKQAPTADVKLIRKNNGKVISQGTNLKGYVSSYYDIVVDWTDNGMVKKTWIENSSGIQNESTSKTVKIENLFFTGETTSTYTFAAVDQAGNIQRQNVSLSIVVPDIYVDSVNLDQGTLADIVAKLGTDIDEGKVSFERLRQNAWEVLTGYSNFGRYSSFDISTNQNIIQGKYFKLDNQIYLYDDFKNKIGTIDQVNGNINIDSAYQDKYEIYVNYKQNYPYVGVKDNQQNKDIFQIFMQIDKLDSVSPITVYNNYEIKQLSGSMFGDFSGGYCIKNPETGCEVFVGNAGIYALSPYASLLNGKYRFDSNSNSVIYQIFNDKSVRVGEIKFKPKSFR